MSGKRTGWMVVAAAAATVAGTGPHAADHAAALRGDDLPAALIALVALVGLGLGGWCLLVAALASSGRMRAWAVALTPRIVRGAVFAGAAGALTLAPAHADDAGHPLDGLRLPDRPAIAAHEAPTSVDTTPPDETVVVVRAGDTLWGIAAAHLGRDAGAAATAQACARWYAANRHVIGHDPDLIRPGQRLTPPHEEHS